MNRLSIVAANWKMNGSLALVNSMVSELNNVTLNENVEVVVCPSFPYLAAFSLASDNVNLSKAFSLGAQNLNEFANGAFTGEVSTSMLQEVGASYVIVGHSERRSIYNESSVLVAHKVKAALSAGLKPILCIGESEDERVAEQTEVVLAAQLQPVIDEIGIENFKNVVIAYEPVWAIGTGKTASPEMAQATHQFIREFIAKVDENVAVKLPLLYGGSVNATNCEELFAQADIDGGLIGGASLKAEEFKIICSAAKGK
ncbi:triose-phosphate isomerase [Cognaticolwellia beringensis]|uniref:Triosephosphate isomerase n=1 Tax=Cognaticolwellia beringensis TaxID=1967665 RepID=A0A222G5X0_9GAMM|nr:triose-phosphate isomerase [Cognaticolwellia beringensis]ASP47296.1 triose-phosphate isomerase [Cognaticolwellia beringensis]